MTTDKDLFNLDNDNVLEAETEELSTVGLIVLEQDPVIKYDGLKKFSLELQEKIKALDIPNMEITEDNKGTLRKTRTMINKTKTELENNRKEIKKNILKDYDNFEKVYKELVLKPIDTALDDLKNGIDTIEDKQKKAKYDEIIEYFNEKKIATNINYADFEDLNIKVGVSTIVSGVKKVIDMYFENILLDLNKINNSENKDLLLKHFIGCRKLDQATELTKKELEDIARLNQYISQEKVEILPEIEKVEIKEQETLEQIYEMSFKVFGTLKQLKGIKDYLEKEGIKYE